MTPRERALDALSTIDANSGDGINNHRHSALVDAAYARLAAAMDALYGPLPPPPADRLNVVRL